MRPGNNCINDPRLYKEYYKDKCGDNGSGEEVQNPPIFPETVYYGNAYIPFQQWSGNLYSPEETLCSGTIFPELDQPYTKGGERR